MPHVTRLPEFNCEVSTIREYGRYQTVIWWDSGAQTDYGYRYHSEHARACEDVRLGLINSSRSTNYEEE